MERRARRRYSGTLFAGDAMGELVLTLTRHRRPAVAPPRRHRAAVAAMNRWALVEAGIFLLGCALTGSGIGLIVGLLRGPREWRQ